MLSLLHMTHLLVLLFMPIKYYQIISISMGVMACTRLRLQGRQLHNKDSKSCLSCTRHVYWSSSSFLLNITKICLRVSIMEHTRMSLQFLLQGRSHLLVLLFIPTKYCQIISNSKGVMACKRFQLQGR